MTRQFALWILAPFVVGSATRAQDDFPIVPDDVEVALFAKDPLVRNPCAITFDAKGRLCVGMGPQYRNPKPDTPGDSVWILIDRDRDGVADSRQEFATGFNAIQGLAWKGRDLWVANAPELTVVRDLDGDDSADEYVRVYTDLGNLEHALHGLNVGPDGKIYMSKGNSKGLTQPPDRVAPKPFRELWGVDAPGLPDFPPPLVFKKGEYQKNYHDPADDWGMSGGVLRCDDGGANLEIISRGFRNPWDIAYDSGFNWLGTDNDQTGGDKIFSPFYGADFGWGHAWSYDWKGDDHLPTVPSSGPMFEGSGTGVAFVDSPLFPNKYRNSWLVNDWLRRETYLFRPVWDGALLVPEGGKYSELFANAGGGRSMGESRGRAFDPTDIEVGPDGAVYIASWGRVYGARYEDGEQANEGRIYRLLPKGAKPIAWRAPKREKPIAQWDRLELFDDLGSHLPAWRVEAQAELLRRGADEREALRAVLTGRGASQTLQTWAAWTLGRMAPNDPAIDAMMAGFAKAAPALNLRIQSLRILAQRARLRGEHALPGGLDALLQDPEPRVRHAAILAAHEAEERSWSDDLIERCAVEQDRIVYYSAWNALLALIPKAERKSMLVSEKRPSVRRALLLGLLQEDALEEKEIRAFATDPDSATAALAVRRLGGKAKTEIRGKPLAPGTVASRETPSRPQPAMLPAVNPIAKVSPSTGAAYRVATLQAGVQAYTDRDYTIREVPPELRGEAFVQPANDDADAESGITVKLELRYPSTVYLADDKRGREPPTWARENWEPTDMEISINELSRDPVEMRVLRREFPVGEFVLGTNRDGVRARKGNYLVIVQPKLLDPPDNPTTVEQVLSLIAKADPARGRDLFLSKHGAACAVCHQLEDVGNIYAPDLSEIGYRAQPEFIVRSILEPSAAITEGFGMQILKKKSGESYAGVVISETGKEIKLAMTGGAVVEVPRDEIVGREYPKISAMPASFAALLQPQQVADITAYLVGLKKAEPASPPAPFGIPKGAFRFEKIGDGQLALHLGETKIATYLMNDPVLTRRAFVNVLTPSGIPVTREYPAAATEDHTHMHPGIWLGFGWISGNDYWRMQSQVVFDKFLAEPKSDGGSASFATRNRYLDKAGDATVCFEDTRYEFNLVPGGVSLNVDASFYNEERRFEFGDQEEGGLAARLAKPLSVQFGNGEIINDRGDRDGKGTWGEDFKWIDYSGTVGDKRVGLLIVPHPDNPRASWSHARDYGVLVANPFPKQPRERREPYVKTLVKKGERYRLRYKVLIHEGPAAGFDAAGMAGRLMRE